MIFVDASALVAIILDEEPAAALLRRLEGGGRFFTGPIAVYEAAVNVARKTNGSLADSEGDVRMLLQEAGIRIVPIGAEDAEVAIRAFEQFGKGRHPARLNLGDCFAYAATKTHDASILFVGHDFRQTDLQDALPDLS